MRSAITVAVLAILLSLPTLIVPHHPTHMDVPMGEMSVFDAGASHEDPEPASELFSGIRAFFTENKGLVDNPDVRYYAQGDPLSVGLTPDGLIILIEDDIGSGVRAEGASRGTVNGTYVLRLAFEGHARVEPVGVGALPHLTSSFVGNDPSRWVRGARSFEEVRYYGLYPGVDLRFYFKGGRLKYDFILSSRADPGSVRMRYEGATGLEVEPWTGDLLVSTPLRQLRDERPIILWQEGGDVRSRPGDYSLEGNGVWGYALPDDIPKGIPTIIDPGLEWCTFLGGSRGELLSSVAVDEQGFVYAIGRSDSLDYPTTLGAYNRTPHTYKGLVTKLDPTGSTILFSTFFGGTNNTMVGPTITQGADITPDGNLALASITYCNDCPTTPDAICATFRGHSDVYFLVLDPQGSDLVYASYFGGSGRDWPHDLVVDDVGAVVIAGETASGDWDVPPDMYDNTYNGLNDVFILKLDHTYHTVQAMTYLGGFSNDVSYYVDVDTQQNIVLTGGTFSPDYPTTAGAYCMTYAGSSDGFLTKLDPNCRDLIFSTLYGGSSTDAGCRLQVCDDGRIWVGTETSSVNFPVTPDAQYKQYSGVLDTAISVFDTTGSSLLYSTYFPGAAYESCYGCALDEEGGRIFYYTRTSSSSLPTSKGSYCPIYSGGTNDMLIVGFNLSTYKFDYCTYVGGSGSDSIDFSWGDTLMIDSYGALYLVGVTDSRDFPTTGQAVSRMYGGGGSDGFVLKLDPRPIQEPPDPPTGLVCKAGNNLVEVSWDRPLIESYKIHKYQVFRSTRDSIGSDAVKWSIPKGTMYRDTSAQNGKTYYYWVSAFNSMGESLPAGPVISRPMGSPSEPLNLSASSGNGRVTLSWSPPVTLRGGDLLGYIVLRGGNSNDLQQRALIGSDVTWEDTEVEVGKIYFYSLKAFNELFTGEQSAVVGVQARDRASPPLKVSLVPLDRGALISWEPPASSGGATILGYQIMRSTPNGPTQVVGVKPPSERSFSDYGLINGVEYVYWVAAFTEVGMGYPSETLSVRPTGTPSEPINLHAGRGDRSVYLTWDRPSNDGGWPVTGYRVYAGTEVLVEVESNVNATYYRHTGLANGVLWYYAVAAMNMMGTGPKSNISFAVPLGVSEAPPSFIVEPLVSVVRLSWYTPLDTGGAPIIEYRIYRSAMGAQPELLKSLAPTALSFWDLEVVNGRTYAYYILAVTEMGEGKATSTEQAVPYGPPGRPSGLRAESGDRKVTLHWEPPENDGGRSIEGYCIYRGISHLSMMELAKVTPQGTYIDIGTDITNGVEYFYSIKAMNGAGEGPESDIVSARPGGLPGAVSALDVRTKAGTVLVTWVPPADDGGRLIIGYVIYRGTSTIGMAAYRSLGTTRNFVDPDVDPGEGYYYSVRAVNTEGEGDQGTPKYVEVPPRMSSGWSGESPLFWTIILVVLCVMIAVVIVFLMRFRIAHPKVRGSDDGLPQTPSKGGGKGGGGGGR